MSTPIEFTVELEELDLNFDANMKDSVSLNNSITKTSELNNDGDGKSPFATQEYVENEIATFDFIKVVGSLPEIGLPNRTYLVPKADGEGNDLFDEYIWANDAWEFITTKQVEVDLTDYVKKTDYPTSGKAGVIVPPPMWGGLSIGGVSGVNNTLIMLDSNDVNVINRDGNRRSFKGSLTDIIVKEGLANCKIEWTDEDKAAALALLGVDGIHFVKPDENGVATLSLADIKKPGLYVFGGNRGNISQLSGNIYDFRFLLICKGHQLGGTLSDYEKDTSDYFNYLAIGGRYWWPRLHYGTFAAGGRAFCAIGDVDMNQIALLDKVNQTFLNTQTFSKVPKMTQELQADDNSTNIPNTQWVQQLIAKLKADNNLI